jgi:hypothetical protein
MDIDIEHEYNLLDIADQIGIMLQVNSDKFKKIIELKIPEHDRIIRDKELTQKILLLLQSDREINQFELKLKKPETVKNFYAMKEKLAELQVLTLIKKLEKSDTCDDVLNSFFVVLNNKFESVNNVLTESLNQTGGGSGDINYYSKYLKYKLKNTKLELLIDSV